MPLRSVQDAKLAALEETLVVTQGDKNTLWYTFLFNQVGIPGIKYATKDLESLYLTSLAYPTTLGGLADRWFAYLGSLGYTGALSDRWPPYWEGFDLGFGDGGTASTIAGPPDWDNEDASDGVYDLDVDNGDSNDLP